MKNFKSVIAVLLTLALFAGLLSGCGKKIDVDQYQAPAATEAPAAPAEAGTDAAAPAEGEQTLHTVEITVKDYGTMKLVLDATAAPITVQNFLDLAGRGFYDGLTFHRIMDGFMIQGGDPLGNGSGGASKQIKGEFAANGWDNHISHQKGVISMARAASFDSASSQFFICVGDASFLDGQYAAFGHVTEGLEIVEQIAKDARPIDNNGTIPAKEQPVIESVKVID
jgi:peptidyl-prolyl cis-trans isomerase B (cyclophilin B)